MNASPVKQSAAPEPAAKKQGAAIAGPVLTPFALLGQRLGNSALHRVLQAKLTVSDPQDVFEQEADRVADQVMRMPDTQTIARAPPKIQRVCDKCEEELHRSEESSASAPSVDAATESSIASLSTRGSPLSQSMRSFMEPRFKSDFSAVRIHTDAHAHELARSVEAKAFTVGNNVVFGAGHYAPDSDSGKRLLAHELTHVVQQGGAQARVQRQPVDPQQPPPTAPAPTPPAPFDPDKVEKDIRDQPDADPIPQVDQKTQIADVNDAAARELVKMIFGDDDVNASVGDLSGVVQDDMDSAVVPSKAAVKKAGGLTDEQIEARTQNRILFLKRLRLYFASWNDMLKHFREIEEFTSSEGPMDVLLHRSAMEHFKRALATLKAKGHKMPRIVSGFQLRKAYLHEGAKIDSAGMMIHALGFAFDAFVKGNPRITYTYPEDKGPSRHVLDLQTAVVGSDAVNMNLNVAGRDNQTFIAEMGARTLSLGDVSAAEDTDTKAVEYFKVFEKQFNKMLAGSKQFTQSLAPAHRSALLKMRTDYFAELDAIDAEKKKAKPDAGALAAHKKKLHDLLAAMPQHMVEWVAKLDAEEAKERGKHKDLNMDHLRPPTEIRADQQKNAKDIASANQKLHDAQAAAVRAHTAHQNAEAASRAAKERKVAAQRALSAAQVAPRSRGNGDWEVRDPKVEAADQELKKAQAAVAEAEKAASAAWKSIDEFKRAVDDATDELKNFETQRTALGTELKGSDLPQLQKSWAWIDRLRELRHWLTAPNLESQGGLATFERLMVGDRSERDPRDRVSISDNPPLLRLLDIGYFNPTPEFDLAFFEEMAHHGFVPGASWNPDSVDSMHFQFAAGRNIILEPGKKK